MTSRRPDSQLTFSRGMIASAVPYTFKVAWLSNWGKLEGPRRERKVSFLNLIGKEFEIVRDAVEFSIVMRNLHFV